MESSLVKCNNDTWTDQRSPPPRPQPSLPTTRTTLSSSFSARSPLSYLSFLITPGYLDWDKVRPSHWNQLISLSQSYIGLNEAGATYVCFPKQLFIELVPLGRPAHMCATVTSLHHKGVSDSWEKQELWLYIQWRQKCFEADFPSMSWFEPKLFSLL